CPLREWRDPGDRSDPLGAAPAQRPDEAAVPSRLPGPVPDLRGGPQRGCLFLRGADGRSAVGGARGSEEPARREPVTSENFLTERPRPCPIPSAATPRPAATAGVPTTPSPCPRSRPVRTAARSSSRTAPAATAATTAAAR